MFHLSYFLRAIEKLECRENSTVTLMIIYLFDSSNQPLFAFHQPFNILVISSEFFNMPGSSISFNAPPYALSYFVTLWLYMSMQALMSAENSVPVTKTKNTERIFQKQASQKLSQNSQVFLKSILLNFLNFQLEQ